MLTISIMNLTVTNIVSAVATFSAIVSLICGHLLVFVEKESFNFMKEAFPLSYSFNNSQQAQYDLLQLDGSQCNEFTSGGSVIVSGIMQATQLLNQSNALRKASLHIAIISTNCIKECLILNSVLQRHYDVNAVVISMTPKITNDQLHQVVSSHLHLCT